MVTGEPSAVFKAIEPSAPLIATEEPSLPFTVIEPSVPSVPAALSVSLPKVIVSANFTSYVVAPVVSVFSVICKLLPA